MTVAYWVAPLQHLAINLYTRTYVRVSFGEIQGKCVHMEAAIRFIRVCVDGWPVESGKRLVSSPLPQLLPPPLPLPFLLPGLRGNECNAIIANINTDCCSYNNAATKITTFKSGCNSRNGNRVKRPKTASTMRGEIK